MLRQDIGSDIHLDFSALILGRLGRSFFFKKHAGRRAAFSTCASLTIVE